MTPAKHTPGEWFRMDRRDKDDERPRILITTFRDDGTPDQLIATVNDCDINPTQEHADSVIANARLIAAAPDLLHACADAVEVMERAKKLLRASGLLMEEGTISGPYNRAHVALINALNRAKPTQ